MMQFFIHADKEDTELTALMRRLIWDLVGHTWQTLHFSFIASHMFSIFFVLFYTTPNIIYVSIGVTVQAALSVMTVFYR